MPEGDPGGLLDFESRRLLDLHSLNILDTEAEERFDRLTELLTDALDAPIALVALVDEKRLWFKSRRGLDVCEAGREGSFCSAALDAHDLFVVPDAKTDPSFAGHPMVRGEPGVRFYAGAVLRGPAGLPVGTCCMFDKVPRQLSPREEKLLRDVAGLAQQELDRHRLLQQLRAEVESELFQDLSTGLANARRFRLQLQACMDQARAQGSQLTVVCVRIGAVREHGSASARAEAILRQAAQRLAPLCARPAAMLARCNQDLMAVLSGPPREQMLVLERMASALAEPVQIDNQRLWLSASVGVALYPDIDTASGLIDAAERAAFKRQSGRTGIIRYHDPSVASLEADRLSLKHRLREAILHDALAVAYQPKVVTASGAYTGAEALLRWHDGSSGAVSPLAMIAAAEGSDLIHQLGAWVLRRVARQLREWRETGFNAGPIAVNISAAELLDPGYCERVAAVLSEFEVARGSLHIEITESALVADFRLAAERIAELQRLGIAFALDDFGTGYSSLAYLQQLPVEYLKIDRGFVTDVVTNADTASIVQGIVRLAQGLHLKVIAEGVETNAQALLLRTFGCNYLQGYLFARPLMPEAFEAWVRHR